MIAGINWVTDRRAEFNDGAGDGDPGINIRVVNMSLGGPTNSPANLDPMCSAIDAAVAVGVIFAVAAGNSSSDASGFSPSHCTSPVVVSAFGDFDGKPGALSSQTATFGSCPGPAANQIVHDDTFACFSNYGANVDIAAPGVDIVSTWKAAHDTNRSWLWRSALLLRRSERDQHGDAARRRRSRALRARRWV